MVTPLPGIRPLDAELWRHYHGMRLKAVESRLRVLIVGAIKTMLDDPAADLTTIVTQSHNGPLAQDNAVAYFRTLGFKVRGYSISAPTSLATVASHGALPIILPADIRVYHRWQRQRRELPPNRFRFAITDVLHQLLQRSSRNRILVYRLAEPLSPVVLPRLGVHFQTLGWVVTPIPATRSLQLAPPRR